MFHSCRAARTNMFTDISEDCNPHFNGAKNDKISVQGILSLKELMVLISAVACPCFELSLLWSKKAGITKLAWNSLNSKLINFSVFIICSLHCSRMPYNSISAFVPSFHNPVYCIISFGTIECFRKYTIFLGSIQCWHAFIVFSIKTSVSQTKYHGLRATKERKQNVQCNQKGLILKC